MPKKKFTDEQKAEVLKKAEPYLISGWNLKSIYRQLEAEYQSEGKELISWWSFYPLATQLRLELEAEGKISANANRVDLVDTVDEVDGAVTEAAGEAAEVDGANLSDGSDQSDGSDSADGEAPSEAAGDYVRKLEAVVRLYRRRTEADVDAVCDCLLPDLCAEEE